MTRPVERQAAYVLHRRPYRETSAIVEFLTHDFGRIAGVARGTRGSKKARPMEPFIKFQVSWRGRGQLRTVTSAEAVERITLTGDRLYAGLYLNEVLLRALREEEAMTPLFEAYQRALLTLAESVDIEPALRIFEKRLLRELGYELTCDYDTESGQPVSPDEYYRFVDGQGFCSTSPTDVEGIRGEVLMMIGQDQYDELEVRRSAKRLLRAALRPHVGERPFASRALFRPSAGGSM